MWLSNNPSKRWAELFFLLYSPFWIVWALVVLVPLQLFEVGAHFPAGDVCMDAGGEGGACIRICWVACMRICWVACMRICWVACMCVCWGACIRICWGACLYMLGCMHA